MIECKKTNELIKIKGGNDQNITVYHTHHGPLLEYYLENKKLRDH